VLGRSVGEDVSDRPELLERRQAGTSLPVRREIACTSGCARCARHGQPEATQVRWGSVEKTTKVGSERPALASRRLRRPLCHRPVRHLPPVCCLPSFPPPLLRRHQLPVPALRRAHHLLLLHAADARQMRVRVRGPFARATTPPSCADSSAACAASSTQRRRRERAVDTGTRVCLFISAYAVHFLECQIGHVTLRACQLSNRQVHSVSSHAD
jgi:hypothetical protein